MPREERRQLQLGQRRIGEAARGRAGEEQGRADRDVRRNADQGEDDANTKKALPLSQPKGNRLAIDLVFAVVRCALFGGFAVGENIFSNFVTESQLPGKVGKLLLQGIGAVGSMSGNEELVESCERLAAIPVFSIKDFVEYICQHDDAKKDLEKLKGRMDDAASSFIGEGGQVDERRVREAEAAFSQVRREMAELPPQQLEPGT